MIKDLSDVEIQVEISRLNKELQDRRVKALLEARAKEEADKLAREAQTKELKGRIEGKFEEAFKALKAASDLKNSDAGKFVRLSYYDEGSLKIIDELRKLQVIPNSWSSSSIGC